MSPEIRTRVGIGHAARGHPTDSTEQIGSPIPFAYRAPWSLFSTFHTDEGLHIRMIDKRKDTADEGRDNQIDQQLV